MRHATGQCPSRLSPVFAILALGLLCALALSRPAPAWDSTKAPAEGLTHASLGSASAAVGMVLPWPAGDAPSDPGWLECDGSAFDADAYPLLAAALGATTLPDYRGRFLRGAGSQQALLSDGKTVTYAAGALGVPQEGAIASHSHELSLVSPMGGTGDTLTATGTATVRVPTTVTETVTATADTSSIAAIAAGVHYDEDANHPYTLFAAVLPRYCDSTCDCYCLGSAYGWCGTPGLWLHADLATVEEADATPGGYAAWKKLARASYALIVDSGGVVTGYTVYCRPHETTTTVTSIEYQDVEEELELTVSSTAATLAMPAGADAMATEAAGDGDAVVPVHAPVRWFIRAE